MATIPLPSQRRKILINGSILGITHEGTTDPQQPRSRLPISFEIPARRGPISRAQWVAAKIEEESGDFAQVLGLTRDTVATFVVMNFREDGTLRKEVTEHHPITYLVDLHHLIADE